jgi:hypothetical protein
MTASPAACGKRRRRSSKNHMMLRRFTSNVVADDCVISRVHELILLLISFDLNPPNVCCLLQVEIFCQQRESQSELKVAAGDNYVPLYGARPSMKQAIHCSQANCVAGSNHLHQG